MTDQPNNDDGHAVLRPPPGYAWQNGELTRVTPTDGHAHHVEGEDPFTAGLRGMVNENRLAVEIDQPGDPARPLDPPGGPVAVYRTAYLAKARDLGLDLGAMSPTRAQFDECIAAGLAAVDAVAVEPDDGLVTRAALDAANAVAWPGGEDDERVSIDDEDDLRAVLAAAAPYLTGHDHPKYQEGYRAGYQRAEGIERIAALQAKPATILGHQPEPTDDGHVHHVEGEDPQTAALRDAVNKNRQVEGIDPPTDHEPTVRVLLLEDGVDSTLDLQVKILDSGIAGASPMLALSRPGEDRPAVTIAQRLLLRVAAAVAPSPDPVAVFGRYDHTERTGSAVIYDRGGRLDLKWVDRAAQVTITPDVVEGFVEQINALRAEVATWKERARNANARAVELCEERDRARDVAVALEQELAGYDARVEAALKQVIRTAGTVDAREQVGFVLAGWQDPDPDPIGVPPSVATRAVEIATDVDWPDLVRTRVSLTVDDPDAHRPAVAAGEWVRILERPAGRPAGQIGKVIPPGFTPPSTVASRVIAVKVGPADSIDASAWEVIDHPGQAVVVAQPHSFYPAGLPQFCQTCGGIESDPQHQPAPGSERQGNQ